MSKIKSIMGRTASDPKNVYDKGICLLRCVLFNTREGAEDVTESHKRMLESLLKEVEQEAYERGRREMVEILHTEFREREKGAMQDVITDSVIAGWYQAWQFLKSKLTHADRIKEDFGDVLSKLSKE